MSNYRVHLLNSWGTIVQSVEINCSSDNEARTLLERFAGLFPLELWQGDRLVDRYEAELGI
jgi:hypothetical protein